MISFKTIDLSVFIFKFTYCFIGCHQDFRFSMFNIKFIIERNMSMNSRFVKT